MAGYSKTPLRDKLGIKAHSRVVVLGAPAGFLASLDPLPEGVVVRSRLTGENDIVHLFCHDADVLAQRFPALVAATVEAGAVWISWPKGASKVKTSLDENVVRRIGLATGVVDVKVCAVDDVYSGLKFVRRLEDRVGGSSKRSAKDTSPTKSTAKKSSAKKSSAKKSSAKKRAMR